MNRRAFLRGSVYASGAALSGWRGVGQAAPSLLLGLKIRPEARGNPIPADFTGLSYETAQLSDPTFFSPDNTELIGFLRRLGASGVLRIGGNTSEYCYWTPDEKAGEPGVPQALDPDTGKAPAKPRKITPQAVRNLRGFIGATGWRLIYGLNMGTENAPTAAAEAEYVYRTLGEKLIAFQLCNEPDLFHRNGLRGADYNFAQFATEWQQFFEVIRKRLPGARFAGPDTAFNNEWLVPFAKRFRDDVVFLSQHYYAEGPPTDPSMTIERLLKPDPKLKAELEGMQTTKAETRLPFRLAETNSCYSAGKEGVSNTFASALWGAELMYELAAAGGSGINFHGGGYGWYTPIAGTVTDGFVARPIYYGMLLFAQAGPGHLVETQLEGTESAPQVTAYALEGSRAGQAGAVKAILFNQHREDAARISIDCGGRASHARVLRLRAPRLDGTTDVTLGANPVGAAGAWEAAHHPMVPVKNGVAEVELPAGSAALVTFEAGGAHSG